MDELDEEILAMRAQFSALIADWCLAHGQAALVQGVDPSTLELDLMPHRTSAAVERRMRILLDINSQIPIVSGGVTKAEWLREPCECADGESRTVLRILEGPIEHLRAVRDWLQLGRNRAMVP